MSSRRVEPTLIPATVAGGAALAADDQPTRRSWSNHSFNPLSHETLVALQPGSFDPGLPGVFCVAPTARSASDLLLPKGIRRDAPETILNTRSPSPSSASADAAASAGPNSCTAATPAACELATGEGLSGGEGDVARSAGRSHPSSPSANTRYAAFVMSSVPEELSILTIDQSLVSSLSYEKTARAPIGVYFRIPNNGE